MLGSKFARSSALAVVMVLSVVGASCGSDSATTPAVPAADGPCSKLTREEVAAALGQPVSAPEEDMEEGSPTCEWRGTVASASDDVSSRIKVELAVLALTAEDRTSLQSLVEDSDNIVVPGLGDLAVIQNRITPSPLFVVSGEQTLVIDLANFAMPADFTEDEVVALLTALGTAALARI